MGWGSENGYFLLFGRMTSLAAQGYTLTNCDSIINIQS